MNSPAASVPLARNRRFHILFAADTISGFGDRIHALALYLLVYHLTGRALDLGLVAIVQVVPVTLLAPLSGWLVDRVDRRRLMLYMDLFRVGLVLVLPLANSLPQILVVGLFLSLAEEFHSPARMAILPDIVAKKDLVRANAWTMSVSHLLLIVGPAVGGVLIARYGTTLAFQINAATYLASAFLLLWLGPVPPPAREALQSGRQLVRQFVGEVREGVDVIWSDLALRFAILFFAAIILVASLQQPITPVFVEEILEAGAKGLGQVAAAAGLGGILGTALAALLRKRVSPLQMITAACMLDGAALIGFSMVRSVPAAMVFSLLFGLMGGMLQVRVVSLFQARIPDEARGRAMGWLGPVLGPLSMGSVGVGTILADRFGVVPVIAASGGLQAALGVIALGWLAMHPWLTRVSDGEESESVDPAVETA